MDLVGPRYLKGDGRLYVLNIIDVQTHMTQVYPIRSKSAESILAGIVEFWKDHGIPDCLQMDNELSFRGSNRHPRSLGLILRFVLSQGVRPLFIPNGEPWRNGTIEKFNDTFDKKFFRRQLFESFEALQKEAIIFKHFHNQHHRYSVHNGKTPAEMTKFIGEYPRLSKEYQAVDKPPLVDGELYFIRFVRSDRIIRILGDKFQVKGQLVYSYIVAIIIIEKQSLLVCQDGQIHHQFPFVMNVDW